MQEIPPGTAASGPYRERRSGGPFERQRFVDSAVPFSLRAGLAMSLAFALERLVSLDFRGVAGAVVMALAWLAAERLEVAGSRRAALCWAASAAVILGPVWAPSAAVGLLVSAVWLVVFCFLTASEGRFPQSFVIGLVVTMVTAWAIAAAAFGSFDVLPDARAQLQAALVVGSFGIAAVLLHRRMVAAEGWNRRSAALVSTRRDPETGLLGRSAMMEVIRREISRSRRSGRPFALTLTGVDRLDGLSRSRGPECARWVMVTLTDLLHKVIRCEDRLARWGDDRMLLLLRETDVEGALAASRRLQSEIRRSSFVFDGSEVGFTVTMVTVNGHGELDFDGCRRRMEEVLFENQGAGGDRVVLGACAE